jgi:hypothetical protein
MAGAIDRGGGGQEQRRRKKEGRTVDGDVATWSRCIMHLREGIDFLNS